MSPKISDKELLRSLFSKGVRKKLKQMVADGRKRRRKSKKKR